MASIQDPETPSPIAARTTADAPLPCGNCGYDLRAAPPDGRCPECGAPCSVATRADTLLACDPAWLARIVRGARLATMAPIIFCLGLVPGWTALFGTFEFTAAVVLGLGVPAAVFCTGLWLFTTPLPQRAAPGLQRPQLLRATAIIAAASTGLMLMPGAFRSPWWWLLQLSFGPLGAVGLIALRTFAAYTADLASRAGDPKLARRNLTLSSWYTMAWVVAVLMALLGAFGLSAGTAISGAIMLCLLLVIATMLITTPLMLAKRLDDQRAESLEAWGQSVH